MLTKGSTKHLNSFFLQELKNMSCLEGIGIQYNLKHTIFS